MEDLYGNVESYEKRDPDMAAVGVLLKFPVKSLYISSMLLVCLHLGKVLSRPHALRPCRGNESCCMATRH
jgi:hypothetical protein